MRSTPQPDDDPRKYVQLAEELRRLIRNGALRPGQAVPSITTLAAERGWSRGTCRHTLQVLEDEGLVRRAVGLGYFVVFRGTSSGSED
jgi:GntR family transcriptional regulator